MIRDAPFSVLDTELEIIGSEKAVGVNTTERESTAQKKRTAEASTRRIGSRWNEEKQLVEQILEIRSKLRGPTGKVEGTDSKMEHAADDMAKKVSVQTENATPAPAPLTPAEREKLLAELGDLQPKLIALEENRRSFPAASINRRSPRSSLTGRVSPLEKWLRTRSRRSWI